MNRWIHILNTASLRVSSLKMKRRVSYSQDVCIGAQIMYASVSNILAKSHWEIALSIDCAYLLYEKKRILNNRNS